ncbi:MAG: hypothetical protein NTW28_34255 [Candidatus Solibacter sp.]|nr:hypothetical protein [Candidatus Solibacter sp.]
MPKLRTSVWLVLPVLLLVALYWPGLTTWFYQDDFGWLNLRHDVHSARDLAAALLAPKAHGNMRPLGENAFWLGLSAIFGVAPLPFHICAFLTQSASLLLLGSIVRRLVAWAPAGLCAQILWLVNSGLAPAMGWSSIYNQVLSGFFFLLSFYFLLRHIETGRRAHEMAHWTAFMLGLGALEINVVYPALAASYVVFHARPFVKRVLPMFAVSAAAVLAHFYFAPPPHAGVYAPRLDSAIAATLWTYWRWALATPNEAVALLMAACVVALIVWGQRRGESTPLLGAAWFVLPLLPYLPLPDHKMDYYLAVPSIGIAILGAYALGKVREFGSAGRIVAVLVILAYVGTSVQASWAVEDLVLGVEEIHQAAKGKIILLEGIDSDLFWSGVADLPFRAKSIPAVYLAPGSEARIQAAPELLSKYVLPQAIARRALAEHRAVVYRFDGQMLRNRTAQAGALWTEDEPRFVNIGDPVFGDYLGVGWRAAADGCRRMDRAGIVRIAAPRGPGESLYLGVFETRDFLPRVRVNGVEVPVVLARRDLDLTEFRATLPPEAVRWKSMEAAIESPVQAPLLFGYAEVR